MHYATGTSNLPTTPTPSAGGGGTILPTPMAILSRPTPPPGQGGVEGGPLEEEGVVGSTGYHPLEISKKKQPPWKSLHHFSPPRSEPNGGGTSTHDIAEEDASRRAPSLDHTHPPSSVLDSRGSRPRTTATATNTTTTTTPEEMPDTPLEEEEDGRGGGTGGSSRGLLHSSPFTAASIEWEKGMVCGDPLPSVLLAAAQKVVQEKMGSSWERERKELYRRWTQCQQELQEALLSKEEATRSLQVSLSQAQKTAEDAREEAGIAVRQRVIAEQQVEAFAIQVETLTDVKQKLEKTVATLETELQLAAVRLTELEEVKNTNAAFHIQCDGLQAQLHALQEEYERQARIFDLALTQQQLVHQEEGRKWKKEVKEWKSKCLEVRLAKEMWKRGHTWEWLEGNQYEKETESGEKENKTEKEKVEAKQRKKEKKKKRLESTVEWTQHPEENLSANEEGEKGEEAEQESLPFVASTVTSVGANEVELEERGRGVVTCLARATTLPSTRMTTPTAAATARNGGKEEKASPFTDAVEILRTSTQMLSNLSGSIHRSTQFVPH